MPFTLTLGPFLTKPVIQAGTDTNVSVDPLNPNAVQPISTSGGSQPTTSPVAGVVVDLYKPNDDPNNIAPGAGTYTGTTNSNGTVSFILPDINATVSSIPNFSDKLRYRAIYPAGSWDPSSPSYSRVVYGRVDNTV
jgi:hypothetical protein